MFYRSASSSGVPIFTQHNDCLSFAAKASPTNSLARRIISEKLARVLASQCHNFFTSTAFEALKRALIWLLGYAGYVNSFLT